METLHIIEMIVKLNENFGYPEDNEEIVFYEFHTEGLNQRITFLGIKIWDDNNEEREFIENINDYEPLYDFIIKQTKKILKEITKTNI